MAMDFGLENLGENFNELQSSLKSREEIEAYSIDENISDLDRARLYCNQGTVIQKTCLVSNLPALYRLHKSEIENDVLLKLTSNISEQDPDVQVALARVVDQMILDGQLASSFVNTRLLRVMLEVLRQREEVVAQAWSQTLFTAFPNIPKNMLQSEVLDLANSKGELTETVSSRILCCRLYGKLASVLDTRTIEQGFFPKAMALCQDTDFEVRIEMCRQLYAIGRGIGPEHTTKLLLPELLELLNDEELEVRLAAFEAMTQLLEVFEPSTLRDTVIPLIKRFLRGTPDDMIKAVAQLFGQLVIRIWNELDEEDEMPLFCDFYKGLADRSETESRRLCAYNFPAALKAMGPRRYALHLHTVLTTLAEDTHVNVRRTIAASLHEIALLLGKERAVKYIKDVLIKLLKDDSREVQETILPHLDSILSSFAVSGAELKQTTFGDLVQPIVQLANTTTGWRKQSELLDQFVNFPAYFSGDHLNDQFVPLLFNFMNNGAVPVKQLAAKVLCIFLRKLKYRYQRDEVCQKLITEFARGQSFWHRMLFIDICQHLLDTSSRIFFKTNFFFIALELAKDKVPNVRLKLCSMLVQLKRVLKLPKDNIALERLNELTMELTTDVDRDVVMAARRSQQRLATVDVRMEGVTKEDSAEDVEDRRREEEERMMQVIEDSDPDDRKARRGAKPPIAEVRRPVAPVSTVGAGRGTATTTPIVRPGSKPVTPLLQTKQPTPPVPISKVSAPLSGTTNSSASKPSISTSSPVLQPKSTPTTVVSKPLSSTPSPTTSVKITPSLSTTSKPPSSVSSVKSTSTTTTPLVSKPVTPSAVPKGINASVTKTIPTSTVKAPVKTPVAIKR